MRQTRRSVETTSCALVWVSLFVYFFKQKTTYEMRISDWVSDVCSSDLPTIMLTGIAPASLKALKQAGMHASDIDPFEINEAFAAVVLRAIRDLQIDTDKVNDTGGAIALGPPLGAHGAMILGRSEARRVGQECVSTCTVRLSRYHIKKKLTN